MKVAVVVGHSAREQGAENSRYGVTEYMFNSELAILVKWELDRMGLSPVIVHRQDLNKLPGTINKTNADIAVELHCNAFDEHTSGTEVLYFTGSTEGAALAESIQDEMVKVLGLSDRGIKPSTRELVLRETKMPCVITEAGFIDNPRDFKAMVENKKALANSIARGIYLYSLVN